MKNKSPLHYSLIICLCICLLCTACSGGGTSKNTSSIDATQKSTSTPASSSAKDNSVASIQSDYKSAAELEEALNAGVDVFCKIATLRVREINKSLFWYASQHLRFYITGEKTINVGDTITIELIDASVNDDGVWTIFWVWPESSTETESSTENNIDADIKTDYKSAEDLESALNAGVDVVGKTATLTAWEVPTRYNIEVGRHLSLIFGVPFDEVNPGDTITAEIIGVKLRNYGDWTIYCKLYDPSSSDSSKTTTSADEPSTTATTEPVPQDLKIGDIAQYKNFSVGVSVVKSLDYLSTGYSSKEDTLDGQEVIYVFLDVRNDSENVTSFHRDDVSLYYDNNKAPDAEVNYSHASLDGYSDQYSYPLDPETHVVILRGFFVEKGWETLKAYVGDSYWTISPEDLSQEENDNKFLFSFETIPELTTEGSEVYSGDYSIVYDKATLYKSDYNGRYVVFEFTINNTSSKSLDYQFVGYEMRAYHDYYFLGDSVFVLHDTIDNHMNIYDVDEIKAGMSAKLYVAFSTTEDSGVFTCVYDIGYGIAGKILATVNSHIE